MKKILVLLLAIVTISSCDDGDITLESFNFEDQEIQECTDNNLIFKTKNEELLLISLTDEQFDIAFEATPTVDSPRIITISGSNEVIYRKYTGTVSNLTVCATVPVSSPTVLKEWKATGGTISIETNEVLNSSNEVVSHTHNITLLNVNFASTDNSFSFVSYIFGDYKIDVN
ncbi:hypothetical protein FIA58_001630 [Flavobacterium jejuense]|uniref:Lipocalin-like domain-containing protein n=1 Tax=Flavobacterium jejuense TaxID=1544455 RepID=A0ABX0IKM3_9FLAO|nr:hypothetical protein [Flavobacterium jejuense]NHN24362.1 hypothetical protein [Flavobacterium jejuense]